MYQDLPYTEFLGMFRQICIRNQTGILFFVADDESWGKFFIDQGRVISYGYRMVWGTEAIPLIRQIRRAKCYFHAKEPENLGAPSGNGGRKPVVPMACSDMLAQLSAQGEGIVVSDDAMLPISALRPLAAPSPAPPRAGPAAVTIHQPAPRAPGDRRILVVDDSAVARMAVARPLVAAGFEVLEAKDGYEGLGLLQTESPDMVILDLVMPGLDGYAVLDTIRRLPRFNEMPVVILTSKDGFIDVMRGKMSSSDGYMTKPFRAEELLKLVHKLLN